MANLVLSRGVAKATWKQLMNAAADINKLSTSVSDHKRNGTRHTMLALVTTHPAYVSDNNRIVYESCAFMQPWKKVGVMTGNRHFNFGEYRKALKAWVNADTATTTAKTAYLAAVAASDADPTNDALNLAEEAALAVYKAARVVLNDTPAPEPFDPNIDWTMITPDWDYGTGAKLVL